MRTYCRQFLTVMFLYMARGKKNNTNLLVEHQSPVEENDPLILNTVKSCVIVCSSMIVVWIESEVQNAANYTSKAGNLHIQSG